MSSGSRPGAPGWPPGASGRTVDGVTGERCVAERLEQGKCAVGRVVQLRLEPLDLLPFLARRVAHLQERHSVTSAHDRTGRTWLDLA